jgi:hypothetical protein
VAVATTEGSLILSFGAIYHADIAGATLSARTTQSFIVFPDTFVPVQKISNVCADRAPDDLSVICARQSLAEIGKFAVDGLAESESCACPRLWHRSDVPCCTMMYIISVDCGLQIRDHKKGSGGRSRPPSCWYYLEVVLREQGHFRGWLFTVSHLSRRYRRYSRTQTVRRMMLIAITPLPGAVAPPLSGAATWKGE